MDKIVKLYNSSDCLIFIGSIEEFDQLKKDNFINDSDRIVFENK